MIADRVPTFLTRRVKNYSLASFMKELRVTIKLSCTVESSTTLLTEEQWKYVVDCYIYGVRHHMLGDKTNTLAVYTKYGVLRNRYQIRKQSFLHFGLLKSKAQNIFEFSTNIFRDRIINCRKVQEAIQEDMSLYIEQNHGLTSDDIRQRKAAIELDLQQNLDLLSSHFKRIGVLTLMMACHYMFRKMFESINFDNKFVENVRNHDYRKGPIIFLPTHKSYMDFMILNYLLALRDARPPMIGAADNMNNIMILSKLFQLSGAFYIKRTGQKFPRVYRSVLNEFIKSILEHEMNLEFFVEATRSRSGQILFPKYGMLKYVIEAYVEKRVPDAILIPINITYENLIEADSYIGEHRGGQKVQENVLRLIKAVGLVFHNFGKLIINSAEPISLKRYMEERSEAGKPFATGNEDEFVQNLGLHLTDTLQQKSVFMHTHLICAILLMRLHYQLVKDVEVSVRLLGEEIKVRKGTLFEMEEHDFNFDSAIKCFKDRLSIRGDTLNERRVCIDRGNYIENCLALKYYANSMNYLFFLEALVHYSAAHQPALERTINLDVLWRKVSILQDMFSSEIYLSRWLENQSSMELFISQKK